MSAICRICLIDLNTKNCQASHLIRKNNICRRCNQDQENVRNKERRLEILEKLGNKCECCGIDNICLLSIDHIYGGGHKDAAKCRGKQYLKKLLKMPEEELFAKYQLLCFNCNYAKGFWKVCTHTLKEEISSSLLVGNHGIKQTHLPAEEKKKRALQLRQILVLKDRLEMIFAYGGGCTICGEKSPLFLVLDHINNNGNLEKNRGHDFYQHLKTLGYPGKGTQLQLLCHNCNAYKEYQENRKQRIHIIKSEPEVYIKGNCYLSKEIKQNLKNQARILFAQISEVKNGKK